MAAYTSSQNGNWSSASTWGGAGVPGNGDTWTVAAGHYVTYDVTTFQSTGLDNGAVNNTGRLTFNSGSRMRSNGQINVYGDWIMPSNTTVSIVGTNTSDHGIYIRHPTNTTDVQRIEMVGSTGMPETNLTSAITHSIGYLPCANASGYATGEWVSSFKRGLTNVNQRTDEGFIVHEVSGNNIYVREFVGPSANVTAYAGNTITVSDASVFREYQTLIFGTGANRTVSNVASINYTTNVITLAVSVNGNSTNSTVYTTGPIRTKNSGDIVRKVATVVTAQATSSATSFSVASAFGYNIGDEIIVDSLNDNNYTDERPERRTITNISGTTITVNSSFGYTLFVGAFVVRLTRNCTITTDDSVGGTNYGYFRIIENNSYNINNKLVMRDVEFRNLGTSIDDFRSRSGPMLNGRYTNDEGHDGVEIEGVTSHRDSARSLTNAGFYFYRFCYRWTVRNCVCYESIQGLWQERGYEMDNLAFFNNYSARSEVYTFRFQDMRYEYAEFAYNYGHRADDAALLVNANRATGIGIHHNWFRMMQIRGITFNINYASFSFFQNRIEGAFGASIFGFTNGMGNFLYNEIIQGAETDYQPDTTITRDELGRDPVQTAIMLEHNYHKDLVAEYWGGGKRVWQPDVQAWYTTHDDDAFSASITAGHNEILYVPANTTLTIYGTIKLADNFSGTPPKLSAREITNRGNSITGNYIVGHSGNPLRSYNTSVNYDNEPGVWQEKVLTVTATKYGKRLSIGIMTQNGNSSEGWYEKPMEIRYNPSLPLEFYSGINKYSSSSIVNLPASTNRIRIGGRVV
jgi:hypothetical protein